LVPFFQSFIEPHGYGIVREYVGHGIGRLLHETPSVPNNGKPHKGTLTGRNADVVLGASEAADKAIVVRTLLDQNAQPVEPAPEAEPAKEPLEMTREESAAIRITQLKGVESRGDGIFFVPEKLMTPKRHPPHACNKQNTIR